MFKEVLQDVITERFLNDQISAEKFERLIEKTSVISEFRAYELLGEMQFGPGVLTEGFKEKAAEFGKKVWTGAKKYSGATKQAELYKSLKSATTAGEKAKIWAKIAAIGGAQAGVAGGATYGGYKLATRKKK